MSEERKKKSGAAWKAEEDEKLNKSRAFVELTEYIANEVENDTIVSVLQAHLVAQSPTCCF